MNESEENKMQEVLDQRKNLLKDLVIHLNKVKDEELIEHPVETIVEGFWQMRYAQALAESQPFELRG